MAYPPQPPAEYPPPPGQMPPFTYAPPAKNNGFAITGMVLGLVGLVLFIVPIINWAIDITAIVFSGLGLAAAKRLGGRGKGMAIAGLVCAIVGAILGVVFVVVIKSEMDDQMSEYRAKAMSSEARVNLRNLRSSAQRYQAMESLFPQGHVGPEPAKPCCPDRDNECVTDFSAEIWQQLEFSPYGSAKYSYEYRGRDNGTHFDVYAYGDLDCDGVLSTFHMTDESSEIQATRPTE